MTTTRLRQGLLLAVTLLALRASAALAQGCAMCGNSFEPNDPAVRAFNSSVLFLMIAPYAIFFTALACVALLYRRAMAGRRGIIVPFSRRHTRLPADGPKEVTP
jgi:hypothetical protein